MSQLTFNLCDHVSHIEWPSQVAEVTLNTLATAVTTDFKVNRPLVIDANTKAVEAEYLMKKSHVKLKLVVDENDQFLGTVSFNDLNNQEFVKKVACGETRENLYVNDFMQEKSKLTAIEWRCLENISIRSLIQFLSNSDEQHVLVTDDNGATLRGLISASDIARALHLNVSLHLPVSFRLISRAIGQCEKDAA